MEKAYAPGDNMTISEVQRLERDMRDFESEEGSGDSTVGRPVIEPGYHRLYHVLMAALDQASRGKGSERHEIGDFPFEEQHMLKIAELQDSPDGMVFQVCKKVVEGIRLSDHESRIKELHGAINYLAGIVIYLEKKHDRESNRNC